ncbi:MAG: N-acetylmuramoyl-L-alanine amidase [Lachnospiraceae bacterium]|nr:N-acetylmuramoyl-L-alanine amidase [Lachnospiraceae bacterium]
MALPDNVGRPLSGQEAAQVAGRNSPLIDYIYLSPNGDFPRDNAIQKITIHHMAGDLALEGLGADFAQEDRRASSNYAIDSQGRVALYVEECNRAWTSSSRENDGQAVTIEVANDQVGGDWHVSDEAYEALLALCTDICRRNGIKSLRFTGDASGNLTLHNMFNSQTQCPGPYLESRMEEIAQEVNRRLGNETAF